MGSLKRELEPTWSKHLLRTEISRVAGQTRTVRFVNEFKLNLNYIT